jgi:NAD+ synthase (glutamine-hydrolysing)
MKRVKIGAIALNQTAMDWEGNRDRIIASLDEARDADVRLVCLPELCISGYGCEDMFHSPAFHETAWSMLQQVLPATRGMVACIGLPLMHRHAAYNAAALCVDGKIEGLVAKQFLAGDGIHYEPRWFKAWPADVVTSYESSQGDIPLGDLHFDCGGLRLGFEICEDAWAANRPGRTLAQYSLDAILNPSASHFAFGKKEVRERLVLEGSRAFGVSYVYTNLLGNEAGRAIYDGDAMIASSGRVLARGRRFSFKDHELTIAVVDIEKARMQRARLAHSDPNPSGNAAECIEVAYSWPVQAPSADTPEPEPWELGPDRKEEEFARAVSLALFDYMRKSCSRGFVVSLSGGADSSAVVALVHVLAHRAIADLGAEGLGSKLSYWDGLNTDSIAAFMQSALTTLYQGTRNSSETTRRAAEEVAKSVHARHLELDVDSMVQGYVQMVEEALERKLSWRDDDIALQNIQARVRGPGAWLITNLQGGLLLATSNRSEAAVGYATMDGDTCGGVSPIAGIDKAFLRHWLRWLESDGPDGIGPLQAMRWVNEQQPTAELRPPEQGQTDEGDLMPYPLLDAIEKLAIRDKKAPSEVLEIIVTEHPEYSETNLRDWVKKFFRLWCRNQWKRERYAPSFHLDDENLDPKTWCRFPILSGGFQYELKEL